MADESVEVVVQVAGEDVPAGRMGTHHGRGSQSATFAYQDSYLQRPDAYALDPALSLYGGQQQTPEGRALFGAFSDAAPDGWGRRLLRRRELTDARRLPSSSNATKPVRRICGYCSKVAARSAARGRRRTSSTVAGISESRSSPSRMAMIGM